MTAVTTTSTGIQHWEQLITAQLALIRQARAVYKHSPTALNASSLRAREDRLDYLFGQRARAQIQAQADDLERGAPVIPERETP